MDNMFQNLFGRSFSYLSDVWLVVAYVVCMFAVATFRPQQIGKAVYFRNSYLLFAVYLVIPVVADGILQLLPSDPGPQSVGMGMRAIAKPASYATTVVNVIVNIAAKCLLATSICYGLASLLQGKSAAANSRAD
jgi:hypothetical protein